MLLSYDSGKPESVLTEQVDRSRIVSIHSFNNKFGPKETAILSETKAIIYAQ